LCPVGGVFKELIQLNAALLVATARPSIEAARAATTDLPILANDLESDPVGGVMPIQLYPKDTSAALSVNVPA